MVVVLTYVLILFTIAPLYYRVNPGPTAIVNVEDWYLVFSLMSNAAVGPAGRPYIWGIINFLVNFNLITEKNFSSCRHLLLRFLFGYVYLHLLLLFYHHLFNSLVLCSILYIVGSVSYPCSFD